MRPPPHSRADWEQAELFRDLLGDRPADLFVLWCLKRRFCTCAEDFRRHYGDAMQIEARVQWLQERGLIQYVGAELMLTAKGEIIIAPLCAYPPSA
jgi:hypothetical protein